jgi:thioester reductase-like protein
MAKPVNVDGARELLKVATHGKTKPINYISTLGIFGHSPSNANRIVSEMSPIDHEEHPMAHGYLASKWVAERIFMIANERGVPCNIFRLGLVWADSQHGRYDELQREYRIFKSCLLSGSGIKNYRYETAPTPVDYAARAVVFLASRHHDGGGIFHISSADQSVEGVFERCNAIAGISLDLLPYYDWIREMKRLHRAGRSLPVVPLVEFAFSMDDASIRKHLEYIRSTSTRFDCNQTHAELERAGIVAPIFNDELIRVYLESMLSRDAELRQDVDGNSNRLQVGLGET